MFVRIGFYGIVEYLQDWEDAGALFYGLARHPPLDFALSPQ